MQVVPLCSPKSTFVMKTPLATAMPGDGGVYAPDRSMRSPFWIVNAPFSEPKPPGNSRPMSAAKTNGSAL